MENTLNIDSLQETIRLEKSRLKNVAQVSNTRKSKYQLLISGMTLGYSVDYQKLFDNIDFLKTKIAIGSSHPREIVLKMPLIYGEFSAKTKNQILLLRATTTMVVDYETADDNYVVYISGLEYGYKDQHESYFKRFNVGLNNFFTIFILLNDPNFKTEIINHRMQLFFNIRMNHIISLLNQVYDCSFLDIYFQGDIFEYQKKLDFLPIQETESLMQVFNVYFLTFCETSYEAKKNDFFALLNSYLDKIEVGLTELLKNKEELVRTKRLTKEWL